MLRGDITYRIWKETHYVDIYHDGDIICVLLGDEVKIGERETYPYLLKSYNNGKCTGFLLTEDKPKEKKPHLS